MTAKTLRHKYQSAVADAGNASEVGPSEWNDEHDLWLGFRSIGTTTDTIQHGDHLSLLVYSNVAAITASIAAPGGGNFPVGWAATVRNKGPSNLTIQGTSGATINSAASIVLAPDEALQLQSTGTANYEAVRVSPATGYLPLSGGTMTGKITLDANPVNNLHAAPKQYVDTMIPKAGGTMTGLLTLSGDPSTGLHAATKQYADTMLPKAGGSMTGFIVLHANPTGAMHAAPKQYVDNNFLGLAGGTMTGPLTLSGDPSTALHAATRQYVDSMVGGGATNPAVIGIQTFTASGTYTPTPGMVNCLMRAIAGGGAGGGVTGAASYIYAGAGGGSGGYSESFKTAAEVGASQPVTVGAGGIGASAAAGSNGGDSSVGSLCIAKGGIGGAQYTGAVAPPAGGAGGPPGTGNVFAAAGNPGGPGGWLVTSNGSGPHANFGGASAFGGGAVDVKPINAQWSSGTAARNYGGGGAGATANNSAASAAGGNGWPGIIVIIEFGSGPKGEPGPSGPGTGDVLRSGTPTAGMLARWTDGSHIEGFNGPILDAPTAGRLSYVSPTQLKFAPFNGGKIRINGTLYDIPSGGVTIGNSSVYVDFAVTNLAPNTTYVVGLYWTGSALAPQFFTSLSHSPSTAAGNVGTEIVAADTITLIGMIRTNASGQFEDSITKRFVDSWFNPVDRTAMVDVSGSATASTSFVVLGGGLLEWVMFAPRRGRIVFTGNAANNTQFYTTYSSLNYNGVSQSSTAYLSSSAMSANYGAPFTLVFPIGESGLTEGYFSAQPIGAVTGNTGSWSVSTFRAYLDK